ncbi:3-mercaptopyruvate sulfurtransferase [Devosia sp.]|uniref:3-mercaptopyruvate sulfurtransferase n=1 Tax=Devosia sp. TaxID=1871048 RepID=UPI001ACAB839|nr:3-mercaptopyruvate sulfurtransferase [Devosia sp.]MBN9333728.1 3-mercaptopyruvate sulfurtransferase [Devosia sp.]
MSRTAHLITAQELTDRLGAPDLKVLDASWYLPAQGRDGRAEFEAGHIPGAQFFDIEAASDPDSSLPHTLASPAHFEATIRSLGINEGDEVVVYDGAGLFSAARAWWNLRLAGIDRARVLDGGFPAWTRAGFAVDRGPSPKVSDGSVRVRYDGHRITSFSRMLERVKAGDVHILDARAAARYAGTVAEPRPGLSSGHMPGSTNIPFSALLTTSGHVLQDAELAALFDSNGVDNAKSIVTTCGSGVTAAVLSLGLAILGRTDVSLYDGSWSEWGGREESASLISRSGPSTIA